jgi:hypothetical protein
LGDALSNLLKLDVDSILPVIGLGLLASAGSPFWNSILEYLLKIRDLKKAEVAHMKAMEKTETVKAEKIKVEAEVMRARAPQPESE